MNGIGTDIIEIKTIKNLIKRKDFLESVFTKKEIEYAKRKDHGKRKIEHLATAFAGKEAVFKALGLKWFNPKEIEILRNKKGKPYARNKKINLSLSYTKSYAVAFAVVN